MRIVEIKMRLGYSGLICLLIVVSVLSISFTVRAQSIGELQDRISERNSDIKKIEEEIVVYQKQINDLGTQANSLSATIKGLELTEKKLAADISVTQNKIENKNLELSELGIQIVGKEDKIVDSRTVVSHSLSLIDQVDKKSLPEIFLGSRSISDTFGSIDELSLIQGNLVTHINELREVKATLEANKRATERAKADLQVLNTQLKNQRQVIVNTQKEKASLLAETKQSESQYQKLLAQKKVLKDAFEKEVVQFEAELKFAVDRSKLPSAGSGVLAFPLDQIMVTQYFGDTSFSNANPQIYNGRGHTGVDFRASVGTPIKSAGSGVIVGVGNTDLIPRCYSYGKWIMVKHPNGLSTLYAHLSLPTAQMGDTVRSGQVIGYSGNTGYSTGPHLHFGVYATEGVRITTLDSSVNCRNAVLPVASFNAYLNPLSYLPMI